MALRYCPAGVDWTAAPPGTEPAQGVRRLPVSGDAVGSRGRRFRLACRAAAVSACGAVTGASRGMFLDRSWALSRRGPGLQRFRTYRALPRQMPFALPVALGPFPSRTRALSIGPGAAAGQERAGCSDPLGHCRCRSRCRCNAARRSSDLGAQPGGCQGIGNCAALASVPSVCRVGPAVVSRAGLRLQTAAAPKHAKQSHFQQP